MWEAKRSFIISLSLTPVSIIMDNSPDGQKRRQRAQNRQERFYRIGTGCMIRKEIGIIGGGASGLMAAIAAAQADGAESCNITVLEKKDRVGKKLLATGNGKCNLTNLSFSVENPEQYYRSQNPEVLPGLFRQFGALDTLKQFRRMGMLVMDRNGYVYPLSQQAATVLDTLRFTLEEQGTQVVTDCTAEKISVSAKGPEAGFFVRAGGEDWLFRRLILACGSIAGEKNADYGGYALAKSLGHTILGPLPALVQLRCAGNFWKGLAGVRCDAWIQLHISGRKGRELHEEQGELQLTDYGISGIPVFQLSRFAAAALEDGRKVRAVIDFLPGFRGKEELWKELTGEKCAACRHRSLETVFSGLVNKKIMQTMAKLCGLRMEDRAEPKNLAAVRKVFELLRNFEVQVTGTNPFANAQVCAGGVPLTETDTTLESRICPGLYLAGELLDADGRCGGYNLQWAWTTGYIAGKNAALSLKNMDL